MMLLFVVDVWCCCSCSCSYCLLLLLSVIVLVACCCLLLVLVLVLLFQIVFSRRRPPPDGISPTKWQRICHNNYKGFCRRAARGCPCSYLHVPPDESMVGSNSWACKWGKDCQLVAVGRCRYQHPDPPAVRAAPSTSAVLAGRAAPERPQRSASNCHLCVDADVDTALVHCGQQLACRRCVQNLTSCPVCRSDIQKTLHTYMC